MVATQTPSCVAQIPSGRHSHRDVAAEHKMICDRAIARDAPGVVEALSQHINITSQLLLDDYEQHEEKGKQDPGPPSGC
ncbi:hypothetical protein ACWCYL_18620 [Streptomyces sp. 900105755]